MSEIPACAVASQLSMVKGESIVAAFVVRSAEFLRAPSSRQISCPLCGNE